MGEEVCDYELEVLDERLQVAPLNEFVAHQLQLNIFVDNVVAHLEVDLHEFFKDLLCGNLVDDRKSIKPLELGVDLLEGSDPVCREFYLVFFFNLPVSLIMLAVDLSWVVLRENIFEV